VGFNLKSSGDVGGGGGREASNVGPLGSLVSVCYDEGVGIQILRRGAGKGGGSVGFLKASG